MDDSWIPSSFFHIEYTQQLEKGVLADLKSNGETNLEQAFGLIFGAHDDFTLVLGS